MSIKEEMICRLCFNSAKDDFEIIDDIMGEMFNVVLLNLNLDISENPIVCRNCAEATRKSFSFKSVCIDTEKIILSFAVDKLEATFDLQDIYKESEDVGTVFDEDFTICRFCMTQKERSNFVSMDYLTNDAMFVDMLPLFMPEVDLNITKEIVICTSCRENLESYFRFVRISLSREGEINTYNRIERTKNVGHVKLHNMQHFMYKDSLRQAYKSTQMPVIKQEAGIFEGTESIYPEVYYDPIQTDELDIKDEEISLNKYSCKNSPHVVPSEIRAFHNCMECSCETKHKRCLKTHKDSSRVKMHRCAKCTFETKYKMHLKKHMRTHEDATEIEMYKCVSCTYKTKYKTHLTTHMLTHKDPSEIDMYKCVMCTFETKYKVNVQKHMLTHKDASEIKMYDCTSCAYKTKYKTHLKTHMLTHKDASEAEMYKCVMCTFETKYRMNLKTHMIIHKKSSETRVYTHKCTECTYETKHKRCLKVHMLTHKDTSEVEMYRCATCTYETKYKKRLKVHALTHKDASETEMYKCTICNHKTKYKGNHEYHMKNHNKTSVKAEMYNCTFSVCTFRTRYKSYLKTHMLVHKDASEVEMYKCATCTYETKYKSHLKIHVLIHRDTSEVEMHKCVMCTYETKYKKCLKRHELTHKARQNKSHRTKKIKEPLMCT